MFLREVLDALDLGTADLVANSMGGLWSVVCAIDAPERVSRLAIVGAPPGVNRRVPLQLRLFGLPLVGRPLGRRLLSNPTRESSRKFWGQILVANPDRRDDALLDADVAHMRRNHASIASLMASIIDLGGLRRRLILDEGWRRLEVPTLFLCGEHDRFVTPAVRNAWEAIAMRNPNIQVIDIPGAAHLPWLDEPERVLGELERSLTTAA